MFSSDTGPISGLGLFVNFSAFLIFLIVSIMLLEILRTAPRQVLKKATLVCLCTGSFGMAVHSLDTNYSIPISNLLIGIGLLTILSMRNRAI